MGACATTPDKIDADTGVVTGADPVACVMADAVEFEWAVDPPMEMTAQIDSSLGCTLGQATSEAGALIVPMQCAGEGAEPARAVTLTLWATPEPPTRALVAGAAVTLTEVVDEGQAWLRLEDADGPLVLAAAAEALTPPADASWWTPFLMMPAHTACLADETACGLRRTGVDVRRSGGSPVVVQDAGWQVVGDKGEAQLWVAAAWSQDTTCAEGPGSWFIVGLMATR